MNCFIVMSSLLKMSLQMKFQISLSSDILFQIGKERTSKV